MIPLVAEGLPVVPIATAGVIGFFVAIGVVFYNQLVALDVRSDNAWSDIDVQLKRRHDLIPNIVEAVKGYTGYEKGALEAVVAARAQAMNARGPQAAAAAQRLKRWPSQRSTMRLVQTSGRVSMCASSAG